MFTFQLLQIEKTIHLAGQDDANRRTKLVSVMRQMMSIILQEGSNMNKHRRDSQFMEGLLKTEGTSMDLAADCESQITNLEHGECLIIVAGRKSDNTNKTIEWLV